MTETTLFRRDAARNSVLTKLPEITQEQLFKRVYRVEYAVNDYIMKEGDPSDFLVFLVAGEVSILKYNPTVNQSTPIDHQGPGGVLGEMGVLMMQPRTASVRCVTPVEAWKIDSRDFMSVLEAHPQAMRGLFQDMVKRFESSQHFRVEQANLLTRARDILSRCVTPEVLTKILDTRSPEELLLGEHVDAALLFFDIKGFSTTAEKLSPQELLRAINEHLAIIIEAVQVHNGTIVNFMGDAVLAVFNTPVPVPEPARAAMDCFLMCRKNLAELHQKRHNQELTRFSLGAGVNFGQVVAGAIGAESRFSYTVLGDHVNLTARLESLTRNYPVEMILSENCFNNLTGDLQDQCLLIDLAKVKGRQKPEHLYTINHYDIESKTTYDAALQDYLKGNFEQAALGFNRIADDLSKYMARRCETLAQQDRSKWPGCYVWDHKG